VDEKHDIPSLGTSGRENGPKIRGGSIPPDPDSFFPKDKRKRRAGIGRKPCYPGKLPDGKGAQGQDQGGPSAVCGNDGPANASELVKKTFDVIFP
jgi:hypothetical protein